VKQMVITPQHVGLRKYDIKESILLARAKFEHLPNSVKIKLLNSELKSRLEFFLKRFRMMEIDSNWSLAEWAKVESTADALDGDAPLYYKYTNRGFEGRSFKWLLKELLVLTPGRSKKTIELAIKGTDNLFSILSSAKPGLSQENIDQVKETIRQKTFSDFGLKPWKPSIDF
jgi:hypothetical protein